MNELYAKNKRIHTRGIGTAQDPGGLHATWRAAGESVRNELERLRRPSHSPLVLCIGHALAGIIGLIGLGFLGYFFIVLYGGSERAGIVGAMRWYLGKALAVLGGEAMTRHLCKGLAVLGVLLLAWASLSGPRRTVLDADVQTGSWSGTRFWPAITAVNRWFFVRFITGLVASLAGILCA